MKVILIFLLQCISPDTTLQLYGTGHSSDSLRKEHYWIYNNKLCSGRLNFYYKEGFYANRIDRSCFFTKGELDSICIYEVAFNAYFQKHYIASEIKIKINDKTRILKRWNPYGSLLYYREQKIVSRLDLRKYDNIRNIEYEINYIDHGFVLSYWNENGNIQFSGHYANGNRTGTWQYYSLNGILECTCVYRRNKLIKMIGCDENYKPALQYQTY